MKKKESAGERNLQVELAEPKNVQHLGYIKSEEKGSLKDLLHYLVIAQAFIGFTYITSSDG